MRGAATAKKVTNKHSVIPIHPQVTLQFPSRLGGTSTGQYLDPYSRWKEGIGSPRYHADLVMVDKEPTGPTGRGYKGYKRAPQHLTRLHHVMLQYVVQLFLKDGGFLWTYHRRNLFDKPGISHVHVRVHQGDPSR